MIRRELGIDPIAIDVSRLLDRSVTTLYSHLVTRPTGRAVRTAIESQLAEAPGDEALSLIDFSEVRVLDFSCADEVVAKLLLRFFEDSQPRRAFFVFRGLDESHRDPVEAVLHRHDLATVVEGPGGNFRLLGTSDGDDARVWQEVEEAGHVLADDVSHRFPDAEDRERLNRLARRRLLFHRPGEGDFHALSTLVRDLL